MATATAPALIEPITEWDNDPIAEYTTPSRAVGSIAWTLLAHSQSHGPDIARMIGPEGNRRPTPKGLDSEDVWQFIYDLVNEAAEIGYVFAQIDTAGFASPWEGAALRTSSVARAIAALLQRDVIEDDETFEPGYIERINAEYKARLEVAS